MKTCWCWLGILAIVLVTGCNPSGQAQASPTPAQSTTACSVSALQLGPESFRPYGLARAGPLWFSAFGQVSPGTPAKLAADGEPFDGWKVAIVPDPTATGTVNLSGIECASGKAVRFCYGGCDWTTRLTASVATLRVDVGSHLDYTGYMVFPGPGLMRLTVADSRVLGSVVIEVPAIATALLPSAAYAIQGGCGNTQLYRGGQPDWIKTGIAGLTGMDDSVYAIASPPIAVGFLLGYPLTLGMVGPPKVS